MFYFESGCEFCTCNPTLHSQNWFKWSDLIGQTYSALETLNSLLHPHSSRKAPVLEQWIVCKFPQKQKVFQGALFCAMALQTICQMFPFPDWVNFSSVFPNIQVYLNNKTGKECQVMSAVLFDKLLNNLSFFFLFCNSSWLTFNQNKGRVSVFVKAYISQAFTPKSAGFCNSMNCSCLPK